MRLLEQSVCKERRNTFCYLLCGVLSLCVINVARGISVAGSTALAKAYLKLA